ncbi:MAG: hypothetical protein KAT35_04185 [Candidatus Aenigmarchaeota archaeon]|nr:hypothetical protein [Candidatus Aenigmarchaeota archaeon]
MHAGDEVARPVTKRKAKFMNMDWAVAIGVFMMFVVWSFVYYAGFFSPVTDVTAGMDAAAGKVIGYLETTEYRMPVRYDSPAAGQGVLFAEVAVPPKMGGGVGVFSGESRLDMLSSGRIYWEADLASGENSFEIAYSVADTGWCGDSLDTAGANQTYPLSAVRTDKVSQATLSGLAGKDYQAFRESLGIQNDVRIEWSGDAQGRYGPETPINTDVHVREFTRPLVESGLVEIRVLMWEQ